MCCKRGCCQNFALVVDACNKFVADFGCTTLQFDRERIPERVVHARGASAKGFFEVIGDCFLSQGCACQLFSLSLAYKMLFRVRLQSSGNVHLIRKRASELAALFAQLGAFSQLKCLCVICGGVLCRTF